MLWKKCLAARWKWPMASKCSSAKSLSREAARRIAWLGNRSQISAEKHHDEKYHQVLIKIMWNITVVAITIVMSANKSKMSASSPRIIVNVSNNFHRLYYNGLNEEVWLGKNKWNADVASKARWSAWGGICGALETQYKALLKQRRNSIWQ